MCFSLCSSDAVHGVFVLPRFLALSSLSNAGIEAFVLASDGTGGGRVVPGGSVSSLGLLDALRFRGFVGDCSGGTSDKPGLGSTAIGAGTGTGALCIVSAADALGEVLDVDFCLF